MQYKYVMKVLLAKYWLSGDVLSLHVYGHFKTVFSKSFILKLH